ncbi:MAG: pilus assembly FimT family protein [Burkholderiaceae bacterium]
MPIAKLCTLRNRSGHGFTLIELIVTIATAGILLTVGIPSMRNLIIETRLTGN